jgi:F-type H+-transporting ATPase subunit alpha
MAQEDQVLQIYAATNRDDEKKRGWIREVPTGDVQRWAKEFIEYVHSKAPQIPQEIREKKELSNELKGRINKTLTEFNGLFQPTPHKG